MFVWVMILFSNFAATADAARVGPSLQSKEGMVVAAHPLAARVGAEILERGGNAFDAAIAVSFALGVVEPYGSSLGGEGYAILALADGRKFAIDFRSTAPALATYENLFAAGNPLSVIKNTPKGFCVPGVVAAVAKIHEIGGSLPLKDLVAPAILLAKEGFEINETFAKAVKENWDKLLKNAPDLINKGLPREAGGRFRNPELARTLAIIAERVVMPFTAASSQISSMRL